jgi:hypothetical protein
MATDRWGARVIIMHTRHNTFHISLFPLHFILFIPVYCKSWLQITYMSIPFCSQSEQELHTHFRKICYHHSYDCRNRYIRDSPAHRIEFSLKPQAMYLQTLCSKGTDFSYPSTYCIICYFSIFAKPSLFFPLAAFAILLCAPVFSL